jgi:hypothetical protein
VWHMQHGAGCITLTAAHELFLRNCSTNKAGRDGTRSRLLSSPASPFTIDTISRHYMREPLHTTPPLIHTRC